MGGDWIRTRAGSKGLWQGESSFYICVVFLGKGRNSGNVPPRCWMATRTIHVTNSQHKSILWDRLQWTTGGQLVALYWHRTHSGDWLLKLELSGFEPTSDILYMLRGMLSGKLTLLVRHHTVKAKGERGGKVRCLNMGSAEATVVLRISETIKARKTSNCQDWRKSVV